MSRLGREKKTSQELEELVRAKLGLQDVTVKVLWDKIYGWNAFPVPVPAHVPDINARLQRAVEELRKEYELHSADDEAAHRT